MSTRGVGSVSLSELGNSKSSGTPADRFMTAWKHIEAWLRTNHNDGRVEEADSFIDKASRTGAVSKDVADFLHKCRLARNAYAHVAFDGYDGPVTLPPKPVLERLERICASLRTPAKVTALAPTAITCSAETQLHVALRVMGEHDYSQVPYIHPDHGWVLVTRDQVARWVETEAEEDGTALVSLGTAVRTLTDHPRVGPVIPRMISPGALVTEAVAELETALRVPDIEPGGYPVVLAVPTAGDDVRILCPDDLPHMYRLLGR